VNLLITNAKIITPTAIYARGWLLCRDGKIAALNGGDAPAFESVPVLDAGGLSLIPGFIDVHVHGADGFDTMDASPEGLTRMAQFYARHGVTSFLATTWTDTNDHITAALKNVKAHQGKQPNGATILGVHLEGPYINRAKGGAQNLDLIRRSSREEALPWLDVDVIKLVALAPEYDENHWLIAECVRRGITVSQAHTDATYDQTLKAIELGITQATHTFNAMPPLHHRDPGVLGAVMASDAVRCELIADNIHVHPAAMNVLWRMKQPDKLVLISDSIRAVGKPDGEYPVDERITYVKNGVARLKDGTLAGSTLTMDRGLYNFMQATGEPLEKVWQCASLNAAQAIHVGHAKGSIEIGKDADFALVDDRISVTNTIVGGEVVYSAK
jgi:N-acetylglucosamine-6-phosphate deacetylase